MLEEEGEQSCRLGKVKTVGVVKACLSRKRAKRSKRDLEETEGSVGGVLTY